MVDVLLVVVRARAVLELLSRSTVSPHREVVQARALLRLSDGFSVRSTAVAVGKYPNTITAWRDRFIESGVDSIGVIRPGRGRKAGISTAIVEAIVHDTLHTKPDDGSVAWSTRAMADRHAVGKDTVQRIWKTRGLRPWRTDGFKLSNDPNFEAKLVDVVGLYLNPPERAVVFSFDEKTQVQALNRSQPSLPMTPGQVLHDTRKRHAGEDVLAFFKLIDLHVPRHLDVHVVLDNLSAHKSEPVMKWLADPKRKRWTLHFTPTSASWLNMIEGWFSVLTRKALKNSSFNSVAEVEAKIDLWASHWNDNPQPFVWTKTVDDIMTKVKRARATLTDVIESATNH